MKKTCTYTTTNSYSTMNMCTDKTKNVWLVFHGIGYLSEFFIKYFRDLNPEENYIICLQAPSKYYKDTKTYDQVGACWLTRENTDIDIENVLNYVDAVVNQELRMNASQQLIVLGYSQGVSIASRWVGRRQRVCNKLILVSGGIPTEFVSENFDHCKGLKVIHTVGACDPLFSKAEVKNQEDYIFSLFGDRLTICNHDKGHKIDKILFSKYLAI